jgi:hypothetical protein
MKVLEALTASMYLNVNYIRESAMVHRRHLLTALLVVTVSGFQFWAKSQSATPPELVPQNLLYPGNPSGYRPLVPVREDYGPGFVFKASRKGNDIIFGDVVCTNLYPGVKARAPAVVLTNTRFDNTNNAGVNLSLLQAIIGAGKSASLEGKYGREVHFTVALGDASDEYIPLSDLWSGRRKPRSVDPQCQAAIDDLKMKGQFRDSVFVVARALTVHGLSYTFENETGPSASLVLEIKNLIKLGGNADVSIQDSGKSTTVNAKTPVHLGVQVEAVDQWVPNGAVGAAERSEATITGHKVAGTYTVVTE